MRAAGLGLGAVVCVALQGMLPWGGGFRPALLPGYVIWAGLSAGGDRAMKLGLFGGILWTVLFGSPWTVLFFALLGGVSGQVFHRPAGFWGKWVRAIPLLLGWEGLQALCCLGKGTWQTVLGMAGGEWLASALCLPLVGLIWRGMAGREERGRI